MRNQQAIQPGYVSTELVKSRWRILMGALAGSVLGVASSFLTDPTYQVDVLLAPVKHSSGAGGLQGLSGQLGGIASLAGVSLGAESEDAASIAMLKSRLLARAIIEEDQLLPMLFSKKWDAAQKNWKSQNPEDIPSLWDGERRFSKKVRRVSEDRKTGLVTLTVAWSDPTVAAKWAGDLVGKTNQLLRARAIETAKINIDYLRQQLDATSIFEVRQSIYRLLEGQMKEMMMAQGNIEYAFKILDPAVAPDEPSGPSRAILAIGGAAVGFFLSCLIVLTLSSSKPAE